MILQQERGTGTGTGAGVGPLSPVPGRVPGTGARTRAMDKNLRLGGEDPIFASTMSVLAPTNNRYECDDVMQLLESFPSMSF
ncbi:unnamed protein product [Sphagnum troendelagicum]|uniref:Uncharacterized protein n=1 Tax=Sphagnum troendelagicum TaxID=128251 RepID=A0ABP0U206_9BRYO